MIYDFLFHHRFHRLSQIIFIIFIGCFLRFVILTTLLFVILTTEGRKNLSNSAAFIYTRSFVAKAPQDDKNGE